MSPIAASCNITKQFKASAVNHFGIFGGVTFCMSWTFLNSTLADSSGFGSELDSTIKQLKKCLVNSWSDGYWTDKYSSRHCSYHGSAIGMSKWVLSANRLNLFVTCDAFRIIKKTPGLPSIRKNFVFSHCDAITVSVSNLRANSVCGGRHPTSHTFNRIPLTELTPPDASRKYAKQKRNESQCCIFIAKWQWCRKFRPK